MPRVGLYTPTSNRYVRHVPADTGGLVSDGCPLDAGTGMILGSNALHLLNESKRHLFSSLGPGTITVKDGWSDVTGPIPTAAQRTSTFQAIGWGYSVAACFGPFFVTEDDDEAHDGLDDLPRRVDASVWCKSDGTHALTIYFTVTAGRVAPSDRPGPQILTASTTSSTLVELRPSAPIDVYGAAQTYLTGAASDAGAGLVTVREYFVWIGWSLAAGGSGAVASMSGWEITG